MDDKTKEAINEVHKHLIHQYNVETCALEMKLHQARQRRMENKIQRYFNSTPIRHAFARWMTYATYTNRTYTIAELVDEIGSNRQTISDIVKDCEAEGWISVDRQDNRADCKATSTLVEKFEEYCDHRRQVVTNIIAVAYTQLRNFEQTMSIGLAPNNDDYTNLIDVVNDEKIVK